MKPQASRLALTMDAMKRTICRFLDVSHAVAAEQNFDRLLPRLLAETLSASDAHAGILYLAEKTSLKPAAALDGNCATLPAKLPPLDAAPAPAPC